MVKEINTAPKETVDAIAAKPTRHYRAWLFQIYLIAAVAGFVVLAVLAKTIAYFTFDVTITHAVQSYHVGWFDALMTALSWVGYIPQGWIIPIGVLLFLLVCGLKWEMVVETINLIASTIIVEVIKNIVTRARPTVDLVQIANPLPGFSFPSGHVMYFTTFMGFLLFLTFTLLKTSWWRTVLMVVLGGMIALIGTSRIYVGHHWASDVTASYLLGSIWLTLSIYLYRWGKTRFFVNQPAAKETPT